MSNPALHLGMPHCDLQLPLVHSCLTFDRSEEECHRMGVDLAIETGFMEQVLREFATRNSLPPTRKVIRRLSRKAIFVDDEEENFTEFCIKGASVVAHFWTSTIGCPRFWKMLELVEDDYLNPDQLPIAWTLDFVRQNADKQPMPASMQLLRWMVLVPDAYKIMQSIRNEITLFPCTRKLNYFLRLASVLESEAVAEEIGHACASRSLAHVDRAVARI